MNLPDETHESTQSMECTIDVSNASLTTALRKAEKLSVKDEEHLFRKMRFVQTRISAVQVTLDPKSPQRRRVLEIERLESECESARNKIAVAHLRLVASIARRLSNGNDQFEEFFSEGMSILLYAIGKFDHTRGFRFSTYVTHAVQRHIYRLIQRRSKRSSQESASDQQILQEETPGSDRSTEFRNDQGAAMAEEALQRIDEVLDDRERSIVKGRFGLDGSGQEKTYQALGDQLGLSKERARQLFNRGIEKLSKEMRPLADDFL